MGFWGIEVKPGKPYTHLFDSALGRLRISQGTLGNGKSTERSLLQCNVGKKSPILLCSLIPNVLETCHLELEFAENEEVIFSVLGQRSVHLSGYFLGHGRSIGGDESDSYGEDIAASDADNSVSFESEDEYESDFIDDDDLGMFPHSPQRKSNVIIEEIVEDEKPANENASWRRLRKKYSASDPDNENIERESQLLIKGSDSKVVESEDEDGFPISFGLRKKDAGKNSTGKTKIDDKALDEERKRKIVDISQDHDSTREIFQASEPSPQPVLRAADNGKLKKKSKGKDKKSVGRESDGKKVGNLNDDEDQDGKAKKDVPNPYVEHEKLANDKNDVDQSVHESSRKLKNKKKRIRQNDEILQEPAEVTMKDSPEEKQSTEMDEGQGRKGTQNIDEDPVIEQPPNDVMPDVEAEPTESAVNQEDDNKKKRKKKKKKSKNIEKDSNPVQGAIETPKSEEKTKLVEEQKDGKRSLKPREFSNGLIIEDLSMGKPDGRRALPGSKVSVQYIGKILKNGKIFDSNIGGKPFSFRMGIGEVIKGWDVGVNGMRVGDKRRLTIPPSMGYGEKNVGKIPGNSWLVFDVELVNVK